MFHIHQDSEDLAFSFPFFCKYLLHDSVTRTLSGIDTMQRGNILSGSGDILLARIESAAAFAFGQIVCGIFLIGSSFLTPLFLIPASVLNLGSRLPGLSSESVKNFTKVSSDLIYQTTRVYLIAIPVIFIFLSASVLNTFIPLSSEQNLFFEAIHSLVNPLGPLKTKKIIGGYMTDVSFPLGTAEEFLRCFSYKNYPEDLNASNRDRIATLMNERIWDGLEDTGIRDTMIRDNMINDNVSANPYY